MQKTKLKKYAELIVRTGVAVQKGQEVIIQASLDQPEFVRMVVKEAYKAGAKKVTVEWHDQAVEKLTMKHASLATLSTVEDWVVTKWERKVEVLPCMIYLESDDPDGLSGVDPVKMGKARQATGKVIKPIRNKMENKYQWCIAAVPGEKWAKKVFPDCKKKEAVERLWEAILFASRVDDQPLLAWEKHNANLKARYEYLNRLHLKSLHYTGDNGTDLHVGLLPEGMFLGGGEHTLGSHIYYNPNIPTEEIFCSPNKDLTEGIVYATKPLSYRGQLIENFYLRFEKGRVVEAHAEKGQEALDSLLSVDEGARRLGECALVPVHSPISELGILFYETLFDENAACHLALGMGFQDCIRDFGNLKKEDFDKMGLNDSIVHEDFMIGYPGLSIVGETIDGKTVQIFKNGEWAFEI